MERKNYLPLWCICVRMKHLANKRKIASSVGRTKVEAAHTHTHTHLENDVRKMKRSVTKITSANLEKLLCFFFIVFKYFSIVGI